MSLYAFAAAVAMTVLTLAGPAASQIDQPSEDVPAEEEIVVATVSENPPALPRDVEAPPATTAPPTTAPVVTTAPPTTARPTTAPPSTAPPTTAPLSTEPPTTAPATTATSAPQTSTAAVAERTGPTTAGARRATLRSRPTLAGSAEPEVLALTPGDRNWNRWYAGLAALVASSTVGLATLRSRQADDEETSETG